MVVLAFNLHGVEGELKLSRAAYAGIFSGRITRWNDPALAATNPGLALPARDIALVTRLDASGTTAAFARNLAAVDPDWKGGAGTVVQWPRQSMQVAGNEGVAARVKMSEGSIGYVEYGFARRLGLPVAALENRAGKFVLPTLQSGQAALTLTDVSDPSRMQQSAVDPAATDAYPIVSYSWLFLYKSYKDAARANELRTFVQWGLTNGQQVARDLGYVPLSEQVVAYGQGILEGRTQ
jgi:phosphate transport system substrate-binding protein